MNWIQAIRNVLGNFWYMLFKELDFIHGLEFIEALYARLLENQHLNWFGGLIAKSIGVVPEELPFVIYIDVDSVQHPIYDLDTILTSDTYTFLTKNPTGGWVAKATSVKREPKLLQDHIFNWSHIWFSSIDFKYKDSEFLFFTDPSSFNWPVVKKATKDGSIKLYYRVFGFTKQPARSADMVYGFISPDLVPYADIVWDMHQNGASWYLTKKLIAEVSGAVISDTEGIINLTGGTQATGFADFWVENDQNCLRVGDKVYHSTQALNSKIVDGFHVTPGTVLFGEVSFARGDAQVSASDIPGVVVQTDVGPLLAINDPEGVAATAYTTGSTTHYILPLQTGSDLQDMSISTAYTQKCKDLIDEKAPQLSVSVPATVNPYDFVVNKIRRGRSGIVQLLSSVTPLLSTALSCIRKYMYTGGILSVYVNTNAIMMVQLHASATASVSALAAEGEIVLNTNEAEANTTV